MRFSLFLSLALLLAACGSDGPPEQTKEEAPSLSGTATYDSRVTVLEVTGKGFTGPSRTASNSSGTNQYNISLLELGAPYALRWHGADTNDQFVALYSVSTGPGHANITPLTTLLIAQLLGQNPTDAFLAFGAASGMQASAVTDAKLQEAQAKLIAYLQDVFGMQVRAGLGSFITTPFNTAAGDPIFDTITALNAKLVADGITLATLGERIATLSRLCIEEKIQVTIGSQQNEFCPASKSATPEESDSSILDYVFTSPTNDTLTIKLQNEAVLSGEYVSAAGDIYTCDGAACNGVAFGTPATDLTRSITFTLTQLNGGAGSVVLSGSLMGAIPGVALPILPCDNNRFFVILEDRTVYADCADVNDFFSLGGISNFTEHGEVPSRAPYRLSSSGTTYPDRPVVELVMDANDSVVSAAFLTFDADGFADKSYYCERSGCNGIGLGPVTVYTDILDPDHPVETRPVTFDNTLLAGLLPDGTPTDTTATLKGSFTIVYYHNVDDPNAFPPQSGCNPGVDTIAMTVMSGEFNFCSNPVDRGTALHPDGTTITLALLDELDSTRIGLHLTADGELISVTHDSSVSSRFICTTNCVGVEVSQPDTNGERTVTFTNAALYEEQSYPLPGERTAILNSGPIVFPPLPP
jgi:hypothetical protein